MSPGTSVQDRLINVPKALNDGVPYEDFAEHVQLQVTGVLHFVYENQGKAVGNSVSQRRDVFQRAFRECKHVVVSKPAILRQSFLYFAKSRDRFSILRKFGVWPCGKRQVRTVVAYPANRAGSLPFVLKQPPSNIIVFFCDSGDCLNVLNDASFIICKDAAYQKGITIDPLFQVR